MQVPQWITEHSKSDGDGWLEFCKCCGYPIFYSLSHHKNSESDWIEYWQPINPVEGDEFLKNIDNCPVCDSDLTDLQFGN